MRQLLRCQGPVWDNGFLAAGSHWPSCGGSRAGPSPMSPARGRAAGWKVGSWGQAQPQGVGACWKPGWAGPGWDIPSEPRQAGLRAAGDWPYCSISGQVGGGPDRQIQLVADTFASAHETRVLAVH